MNYLIGCGGVGCLVLPAWRKITGEVVCVDGDSFETKNLDRQVFDASDLGRNKAQALSEKYGCEFIAEYYHLGLVEHLRNDVLLGAVDNSAARLAIVRSCDQHGCCCILAANENFSAEAVFYQPSWRGSSKDPRVIDPEMERDRAGDPRARGIGCVEAAALGEQRASANLMAAALALQLYTINVQEVRRRPCRFEKETLAHLPSRLVVNLSSAQVTSRG